MSRWQMGVALTAAWLALGVSARAQQFPMMPQPAGTSPMPEPMPYGAAPPGGLPPGTMTPGPFPNFGPGPGSGAAPGGPGCPTDLSLSADHSSAFECCPPMPLTGFVISAGAIALQRQSLGTGSVAAADPFPIHDGIPGPNMQSVMSFNDTHQNFNWGFQGTLGYIIGNQALEATGFFVGGNTTNAQKFSNGQLDGFFFNPPPGFEGDHGLWTHADFMSTAFTSALGNVELNYRYWPAGYAGLDMILGLRYLDHSEKWRMATDDDNLVLIDPYFAALYTSYVHNHILTPQVGAEYTWQPLRWFAFSFLGKAGYGPNFVNSYTALQRGDGLMGFNGHRDTTVFSQVYNAAVFLDFVPHDRMRLRVGYNFLWLVGVATAADQVDYNLQHTAGTGNTNSSVYYHGPSIEFQLLF